MAVGRKSFIILHQNTCKYSFTTLTCQAEDNVFILGGLNCLHYGNESGQTTRSYTTAFPNGVHLYVSFGCNYRFWEHQVLIIVSLEYFHISKVKK